MSKRSKRLKKLHRLHGWGPKWDPQAGPKWARKAFVHGRYSLRAWLRNGAQGVQPFSPEWHLCEEYAAQKHIFVVPF